MGRRVTAAGAAQGQTKRQRNWKELIMLTNHTNAHIAIARLRTRISRKYTNGSIPGKGLTNANFVLEHFVADKTGPPMSGLILARDHLFANSVAEHFPAIKIRFSMSGLTL